MVGAASPLPCNELRAEAARKANTKIGFRAKGNSMLQEWGRTTGQRHHETVSMDLAFQGGVGWRRAERNGRRHNSLCFNSRGPAGVV